MPEREITAAASLAAKAKRGESLSPRELTIETAWLDLRGLGSAWGALSPVARSRAVQVTEALSPCLQLQETAHMVISVDCLSLDGVAAIIAQPLAAAGAADLPISLIRGEQVLDRVEEFSVAGYELQEATYPKRSLLSERQAPASVVAAVPPAVLKQCLNEGTKILISHNVDEPTLQQAFTADATAESSGELAVTFHRGYVAQTLFHDHRQATELEELLRLHLPTTVTAEVQSLDHTTQRLKIITDHSGDFSFACQRCELLLGGLPINLERLKQPLTESWTTSIAPDLLDFGCDTRPAADWLESSNCL